MSNNGPLGSQTNSPEIDSGTLIPALSPSPTPLGSETPDSNSRGLTLGEISMAKQAFSTSLDYAKVKVHNESYFPFGLQNSHTAVTPNGEIYFLPADYLPDFSLGQAWQKHWFIHEMVHVWQYQLGYPVSTRGAIRLGLDYSYVFEAGKKLADYNMEAQGDIIADYFALKFLNNPSVVRNRVSNRNSSTYSIAEYEAVLIDFLANPANTDNLP